MYVIGGGGYRILSWVRAPQVCSLIARGARKFFNASRFSWGAMLGLGTNIRCYDEVGKNLSAPCLYPLLVLERVKVGKMLILIIKYNTNNVCISMNSLLKL